MKATVLLVPVATLALALGGCDCCGKDRRAGGHADMHGSMHASHHGGSGANLQKHESMWTSVTQGVAVVYPTKNNSVSGTVTFTNAGGGLRVSGRITGLTPNGTHAIHIHEFGDQSSADGSAAGGHFNPGGHPHGGPDSDKRHPGDLGNLKADGSGTATIDVTVKDASVAGLKNPVIGRSLVIHEKADDFSQPVGNAGGRIGVGVIGVAKAR